MAIMLLAAGKIRSDEPSNIQMDPMRVLLRVTMRSRRAAHLGRWAD